MGGGPGEGSQSDLSKDSRDCFPPLSENQDTTAWLLPEGTEEMSLGATGCRCLFREGTWAEGTKAGAICFKWTKT